MTTKLVIQISTNNGADKCTIDLSHNFNSNNNKNKNAKNRNIKKASIIFKKIMKLIKNNMSIIMKLIPFIKRFKF